MDACLENIMPIPNPREKEPRKSFISRCVSELTRKGEGKDASQRVAICNSQFKKSKATQVKLTQDEIKVLDRLIGDFNG